MISWLKKLIGQNDNSADIVDFSALKCDMHSHLLPGIDDGSQNIEESISLIQGLIKLGYKKLITTPHTQFEVYKNNPTIINEKLQFLKDELVKREINIPIEAASEYLIDEGFMEKLEAGEILTFGKNYILIETSFNVPHPFFKEIVANIINAKLRPILAHPERYAYLWGKEQKYYDLKNSGLLFQVNINSLSGYYSEHAKKAAKFLIKNDMVDFLGTDTHHEKHIASLNSVYKSKEIQQLLNSGSLLNYTL